MGREREKGSITVFLSLICILFLTLICTVVESARVQGAKAQTANIAGMGNFSVLGEFEKELLDRYEIFSLDGAYGSGSFSAGKVKERLDTYLNYNASPREGIFSVGCFDPWQLELKESRIRKYAVLTDDKGDPFYQQAVAFMRENLGAEAAGALLRYKEDADTVARWQEEYEKKKNESDAALSEAEKAGQEKVRELESEASKEGGTPSAAQRPSVQNPLEEIAKLRKRTTLSIVTGDRAVSGKTVRIWQLPSHSRNRAGGMELENEYSGLTSDLLFREYLLDHFPNYTEEQTEGCLDYQAEYLIGGKSGDTDNLKYTVNRLLLIREGMNYLYCLGDQEMNVQTDALAFSLTGFLGMPAITAAVKHALLLAWAYGESLIDVRILLEKGKVPLAKTAESWVLDLASLGQLSEILERGEKSGGEGLGYRDYLRILLNMGSLKKQRMRGLDLIQANLRMEEKTSGFRAENCIVGIETETTWEIKPVFFSLAQAVMRIRGRAVSVTQSGGMAY